MFSTDRYGGCASSAYRIFCSAGVEAKNCTLTRDLPEAPVVLRALVLARRDAPAVALDRGAHLLLQLGAGEVGRGVLQEEAAAVLLAHGVERLAILGRLRGDAAIALEAVGQLGDRVVVVLVQQQERHTEAPTGRAPRRRRGAPPRARAVASRGSLAIAASISSRRSGGVVGVAGSGTAPAGTGGAVTGAAITAAGASDRAGGRRGCGDPAAGAPGRAGDGGAGAAIAAAGASERTGAAARLAPWSRARPAVGAGAVGAGTASDGEAGGRRHGRDAEAGERQAGRPRRVSASCTGAGGGNGFSCAPRSKISPGPGLDLRRRRARRGLLNSFESSNSEMRRPALALSPRTTISRFGVLALRRVLHLELRQPRVVGQQLRSRRRPTAARSGNAYFFDSAKL